MRIRKHAKLALEGFSKGSGVPARQVYMCQLNQSPWDVMSFGAPEPEPEPKGPYPLLPVQFEGDDSFTGNGSLGDSIGAVESVASMMDSDERAAADIGALVIMPKSDKLFDDNEEVKFGRQREGKKADHYGNTNGNGKRAAEKQLGLGRRGRPRVAKRGSASASNPYEFYYYSGFGPSWGKRRGERGGGEASEKNEIKAAENNSNEISTQKNSASSSTSRINDNNEEFDFIDDEDDEEYEDNGKKRMRKPVKARSLKSLM